MTLGARRVVVAGLGVSGAAAAEALLEEGADGAEVVVTDTADSPALRKSAALLEARGVEVRLGEGHLDVLEGAELVVTSPGIPPRAPLLAAALGRGIPIWSEVELAWRLAEVPVMAVTGTNGKTTTASLLADILCEGGTPAVAAGNIGLPLVTAVRSAAPGSVVVCELSSFQLAFIESFRPAAAILLNVADDHYDWHRGPADYLEAKGRITMNQGPEELFVFPAGDPAALTVASGSRARLAAFGLEAPAEVLGAAEARLGRAVVAGAGLLLEVLAVASGHGLRVLLPRAKIRLQGLHNLENVLAACLLALEWEVEVEAIARAVGAFEGLAHRTRLVGEIGGVTYIDDSKATNPHATLRALAGYGRVVLIAGGRAKGLDLSVLRAALDRLVAVVVMGEAAGELESVFSEVPTKRAGEVEEAVELAASLASPGDTVLLSPACSSLDQYSSYAERGDRFVRAVLAR